MKSILYISLILLLGISSCATLPKQFQTADEVITVGPGPEDMVVDTVSEQPRLLISCSSRRDSAAYYGEINIYYPSSGQVKVFKRYNEPAGIYFHPHGIDLVQVRDTLVLLVVNHDSRIHENAILRYRVYKDSLVYINKIVDPLIVSPNADRAVIDATTAHGMISLPAFFTPTEAFSAVAAGAHGLKLFPAEGSSPAMLKALRAVLPHTVPVYVVGGVTPDNMAQWLAAGATGFGIGSSLYKPGVSAREVSNHARAFTSAWKRLHAPKSVTAASS